MIRLYAIPGRWLLAAKALVKAVYLMPESCIEFLGEQRPAGGDEDQYNNCRGKFYPG
ncbi:MAG: hypothetical protein R2758_09930 [Bacteroidales bacterium]